MPDHDNPLKTPLQFVKGVGPRRAELLAKLELLTAEDLLYRLPRDVLDLTEVSDLSDLVEGSAFTVRGRVVDLDGKTLQNGKTIAAVLIDTGRGFLRGTWFNQPWMLKKFQIQETVLLSGKVKKYQGRWDMSHPRVQLLDADDAVAHGGMLPRYGLTEGLKMHEMRRIVRTVVEQYAEFVPEHLPESFRESEKLPGTTAALRGVHLPANAEQYAAGRQRLIYDDLLEFQLGLALRRREWKGRSQAAELLASAKIDARIRRLLPFQLTAGQDRAVREICEDLASGRAMHRLLQADVGAGKTVVALYAMLVTIAAGRQAILMAPTELLASQHWQTVERLLSESRVQRRLLTGKLSASERHSARQGLKDGSLQLAIGTQTLIQKDVEFHNLGLVVIDEQHKFGVMQRAKFAALASPPHTLVMTATPIPRSLCLTQFGDMDLSVISELPPGRQKVTTHRVLTRANRVKAWEFIRKKLQSGRQAYVVCPRIESGAPPEKGPRAPDETQEMAGTDVSAVATFQSLTAGELKDFQVGLLHGQLPPDEKNRVMQEFREGRTQVLVSTTVVEVGVDVPNATLMIIMQAESFGLSQLHQLRGRIGRGSFQGFCFLFSDVAEEGSTAKLEALEKYISGFEVAEADFLLRGPGDVLGTRQHGDLPLRVADLVRDQEILKTARDAAFKLVASGQFDQPEFAPLKNQVLDRFGKLFDLGRGG